MGDRTLDYVALCVLIFVVLTIVYGVIYIHDIPYEIAKKRKHPHQDAIHTAGWVSLFLMHALWPFLWIWATLYKPGYGWGVGKPNSSDCAPAMGAEPGDEQMVALLDEIEALKARDTQIQCALTQEIKALNTKINEMERHLNGKVEV